MPRCPWTGQSFELTRRGGHERKFYSAEARSQAHNAARAYTEHLIASGFLTWDSLKAWHEKRPNGSRPSFTLAPAASEPSADARQPEAAE